MADRAEAIDRHMVGAIIAHANERAIEAARQLGVPLAQIQRLIMSPKWQKEHKKLVAERFKKGKA